MSTLDDVERGWRNLLLAREPTLMSGADEARQRVYRRLIRNNLSGSIKRGIPILRRVAGEERVDVLITRFLDEVAPKTRLVRYVPPSGELQLTLPPGEYDVVVSRGPEYTAWPDRWPSGGERVDLRTADGQVAAVVAKVVDTTGWM